MPRTPCAKAFAAGGARVHIADMNKQAVKDVIEAND
jgi:NAD(P)-dependent dehydrogenase (short-subunit alcohol dehydrogenase family)